MPSTRYIFNPTNTEVAQLSTTWQCAVGVAPGIHIDGEQPKTVLWLWVREITWYLYTRGVRGRMNAKQRWFKVTVSWMVSSLFSASCSWRPLDWRIRHSHLASTLFYSLIPWWCPWRTWPQITSLSQLETSAMNGMIWIPFGCSINLCQFFWIYSIPFKHQRTCYLQQPFKEYWICIVITICSI